MDKFLTHCASILLTALLCCSAVSLPVHASEDSAELSIAAHSGLRFTAVLPEAPSMPGPELTVAHPDRQGRLQPTQTWPGNANQMSLTLPNPSAHPATDATRTAPQPTSAPRFLLNCSFLC